MLNCRFYRVLYSTGLRFAVTLVVRAGHASADVSAMASLVSEQFQRATVDFYSALGEGELGIAAQVGAAMRAMVCDRVLDSVEDEMARDCLAKLGKAGQVAVDAAAKYRPGVDLATISHAAVACALAGPPFDAHAAAKFSAVATAIVDATGQACAADLTNHASASAHMQPGQPGGPDEIQTADMRVALSWPSVCSLVPYLS